MQFIAVLREKTYITACQLFMDSVMWNGYFFTFQGQIFSVWAQSFAGISIASSGLMTRPPRSCDRLDDNHMTLTAVVVVLLKKLALKGNTNIKQNYS